MKRDRNFETEIEKITPEGKGLCRIDGLVVFVKRAIPGEKVVLRLSKKKRSYAEAEIVEILNPSPYRRSPFCPYFPLCGGCQWQHISYDAQLQYKHELLYEALNRAVGINRDIILPIVDSPDEFHYRNKMEFSFSNRVWNMQRKDRDDTEFALGLHVSGTYYKVLDMEGCMLQSQIGDLILRKVKEWVRENRLSIYDIKRHEGSLRYLTLRYAKGSGKWMVVIVTKREESHSLRKLVGPLRDEIPSIHTVINSINTRKANIAVGEREILLLGDGYIQERIGRYMFRISSNSFFQTNFLNLKRLYDLILELSGLKGGENVLDLYSGTGTISIYVSEIASHVLGIELEESAVKDAWENCKINGVENCSFFKGDILKILPHVRISPDLVIMDPPRAGMHKRVISMLRDMAPPVMLYVSCNPTTLSRDLSLLKEDYAIELIQPIDMFPQTHHVESIVRMVRKRKVR